MDHKLKTGDARTPFIIAVGRLQLKGIVAGRKTGIVGKIAVAAVDPVFTQSAQAVGKTIFILVGEIIDRKMDRYEILPVIEGKRGIGSKSAVAAPAGIIDVDTGDDGIGAESIFLQLIRIEMRYTSHAAKQ